MPHNRSPYLRRKRKEPIPRPQYAPKEPEPSTEVSDFIKVLNEAAKFVADSSK